MGTTPFRRLLAAAALAAAALTPSRADAQQALMFGSWTYFDWFLDPGETAGPTNGDGFSFQSAHAVRLRVTDAGLAGDAFALFANGAQVALTPLVADGPGTGAFDGDAAWADPSLGKVEYLLDPGSYTVTVGVLRTAFGTSDGAGFLRADEVISAGVVPEPAPVALLAAGLGALAAFARRARRDARRRPGA